MKGSVTDIPIHLALLLSGALTIFIVFLVVSSIGNAFPAGTAKDILTTGETALVSFDYMFIFFAVGLGCFSIISAFFIESYPIFFVFSVILLIIMIIGAAVVTNVFDQFITTPEMTAIANNFPYIVTFMRGLPLYFLVIGIIIAIVLHGKPTGGGRA